MCVFDFLRYDHDDELWEYLVGESNIHIPILVYIGVHIVHLCPMIIQLGLLVLLRVKETAIGP